MDTAAAGGGDDGDARPPHRTNTTTTTTTGRPSVRHRSAAHAHYIDTSVLTKPPGCHTRERLAVRTWSSRLFVLCCSPPTTTTACIFNNPLARARPGGPGRRDTTLIYRKTRLLYGGGPRHGTLRASHSLAAGKTHTHTHRVNSSCAQLLASDVLPLFFPNLPPSGHRPRRRR